VYLKVGVVVPLALKKEVCSGLDVIHVIYGHESYQ
jgi:hypothetical protein